MSSNTSFNMLLMHKYLILSICKNVLCKINVICQYDFKWAIKEYNTHLTVLYNCTLFQILDCTSGSTQKTRHPADRNSRTQRR